MRQESEILSHKNKRDKPQKSLKMKNRAGAGLIPKPLYMESAPYLRNLPRWRIDWNKCPWSIDSEFLMSGRANRPEDVLTVQFSRGLEETAKIFCDPEELKKFLVRSLYRTKVVYGYAILADLGSILEWLGKKAVKVKRKSLQHYGVVKYGRFKAKFVDCQSLVHSFGIHRLEDAGVLVGLHKLAKPEWLGKRKPKNREERQYFERYAKRDAVVTSRLVGGIRQLFDADPVRHISAGTLARDYFGFPRRKGWKEKFRNIELMIQQKIFAGRSEVRINGFSKDVGYYDWKSLYPWSMLGTHCLDVERIIECDFKELSIPGGASSLDDWERQGWVLGTVQCNDSIWSLPIKVFNNNVYVTGTFQGLWSTWDLAASQAKILHVVKCWRPIMKPKGMHEMLAKMYLDRVEGKLDEIESMRAKAVMNAASGKLGQNKPKPSVTTNFLAYSLLLGHSHFTMALSQRKCVNKGGKIFGEDTDSIFSDKDLTGKYWTMFDGENYIPSFMDCKGFGDLMFFRSKRYILWDLGQPFVWGKNPVYARHGWDYFLEDYLDLFTQDIHEIRTRRDVKHTLLTREKEALEMALGRWKNKPVRLDEAKITALLVADWKRKREDYDSFHLAMKRKNSKSRPWSEDDVYERIGIDLRAELEDEERLIEF